MSNQWKIARKEKIFVLKSKHICFKILTNRVSEFERKILEKDNVINFLTKRLANNNINPQDSPANTDKIRHNCRFGRVK